MSDQLRDTYSHLFTDLKEWIEKKKSDFEHREPILNLEDVNKQIENFRQYQTEEKPEKIEEKSRLETTFRTLQTRLRLNNRPPYLPSDGMLIADILILWKKLEICEKNYEVSYRFLTSNDLKILVYNPRFFYSGMADGGAQAYHNFGLLAVPFRSQMQDLRSLG